VDLSVRVEMVRSSEDASGPVRTVSALSMNYAQCTRPDCVKIVDELRAVDSQCVNIVDDLRVVDQSGLCENCR